MHQILVRVAWIVAASALSIPSEAQQFQTLPAGFENTYGTASFTPPFYESGSFRWHFVYESSQFALQAPMLIERVEFRPPSNSPGWNAASFANVACSLGAARYGLTSYSNVFDDNWAEGFGRVLRSGPLSVPAGDASGGASAWTLSLSGTPVFYDPTAQENLILELRRESDPGPFYRVHRLDTHVSSAPGGLAAGTASSSLATISTARHTDRVPIVRIAYRPAVGLFPSFRVSSRSGRAPLQVQFTNRSYSSAPGGITSFAWDFDDDGLIDSTAANPTHVYSGCGRFSVSLTVRDGVSAPQTLRLQDLIGVDEHLAQIQADFIGMRRFGSAPLVVDFVDASYPSPSSWSWDFDGDGIEDSNLQYPRHTYTAPGIYNVRLRAANSCRSSTITKNAYIDVRAGTENPAGPEILEYTFDEPRGDRVFNGASMQIAPSRGAVTVYDWQGDPGRPGFGGGLPGTGMLALDPTRSPNVNTGWPLQFSGPFTISFWARIRRPATVSTCVMGDSTLSLLLGTGGVSLGRHSWWMPTLPLGVWRHIAIVQDEFEVRCFADGWPLTQPSQGASPLSHSGTNLRVGASPNLSQAAFTSVGDLDDFRFYARALTRAELAEAMSGEQAGNRHFDSGCPGAGNIVPVLRGEGVPRIGTSSYAQVLTSAEPARQAVLLFGLVPAVAQRSVLPLPFLGSSACALHLLPEVALPFTTSNSASRFPIPIPADGTLRGAHVYSQVIVLGSQGATTDTLDVLVGR